MPRMPDTLGPAQTPVDRYRIPSYDPTIKQKADIEAEQIKQRGVDNLVQGVSSGLGQIQQAQDSQDLANAQAAFLKDKVTQDNAYDDDQDYQTMGPRYQTAVTQSQQTAASMISNPLARKQFIADSSVDVQRGLANIQTKARAKEVDYGRANLTTSVDQNMQAALLAPDSATREGLLRATANQIDASVGKGYLSATEGAETKVRFGNTFIAKRQEALGAQYDTDANAISAQAFKSGDIDSAKRALENMDKQYSGSLPTDVLAKKKSEAFNKTVGMWAQSPNVTPDKIDRYLKGQAPVDNPPVTNEATPQVVDAIINVGEKGRNGQKSPAGALGVMQVLPATARSAAKEMGIPYDQTRLQYDEAYNRQIGTHVMQGLLTKYNGDTMLASAAYNGGSGRVDQWIQQFGDPRTGQISHSDWAALIPIKQTRGYVSRVVGALAQGSATPVQAPIGPGNRSDLLDAAIKKFPRLAQFKDQIAVTEGKPVDENDDGILESYPPWEDSNPVPGKHTEVLYPDRMQGYDQANLVAGDSLHYLGGVDPRTGKAIDPEFRAMKEKFLANMTPFALKDEHKYFETQKARYGDHVPTFDDWMDFSRGDELLMGSLTPDGKVDFSRYNFSPEQKKILSQMKDYLATGPEGATASQPETAPAVIAGVPLSAGSQAIKDGLDPTNLPGLINQAQTRRNQEAAQDEALAKQEQQTVADIWPSHIKSLQMTGKGVDGFNLDDHIAAFSPQQASNLQQQQKDALIIHDQIQPIASGTASEADAALNRAKPIPGSPDFDGQLDVYKAANDAMDARLKGLKDDPGGYLIANDKVAAATFQSLATHDPRANDAEADQIVQSSLNYLRQRQIDMGVTPPNVKPLPQTLANNLAQTLTTSAPADVVVTLDGMGQSYGQDGLKQILSQKGVNPGFSYLAFADAPQDAVTRQTGVTAMQTSEQDAKALVTARGKTDDQLQKALDGQFDNALFLNLPGGALATYRGAMLQTMRIMVGQGIDENDAATAVYQPFVRAYHFTDTLMIPSKFNQDQVENGLRGAIGSLDKFDIDTVGGAAKYLPPGYTADQYKQALQRNHVWVTSPDDKSAILALSDDQGNALAPVMLKNGQRLEVNFEDAQSGLWGSMAPIIRGRTGIPPAVPLPPGAPNAPGAPIAPQAPAAPKAPRAGMPAPSAPRVLPTAPTAPIAPVSPVAPKPPKKGAHDDEPSWKDSFGQVGYWSTTNEKLQEMARKGDKGAQGELKQRGETW